MHAQCHMVERGRYTLPRWMIYSDDTLLPLPRGSIQGELKVQRELSMHTSAMQGGVCSVLACGCIARDKGNTMDGCNATAAACCLFTDPSRTGRMCLDLYGWDWTIDGLPFGWMNQWTIKTGNIPLDVGFSVS